MSCCDKEKKVEINCHGEVVTGKRDWFYLSILAVGAILYFGHLANMQFVNSHLKFTHIFHHFYDLFNLMFIGIVLGIVFVGVLGQVPREFVVSLLGKPGTKNSIFRATAAGLLLDLCSHGILMVGMKLYERGASLGQVMAFLIASPWNSISLTIILFTLIGLKWTLLFILLSGVIAIISGFIFDSLVRRKILPDNPNTITIPDNFNFISEAKSGLSKYQFSSENILIMLKDGLKDSKMILKWIILGAILSSLIKVYVETEVFQQFFGPSLLGLGATLIATTIIEVCSEGSAPIAADLMSRAAAPGNSFTFLMAGVSTDYTEILSLKSTTKSWKIALFLPLVTVPQVLLIGLLLNQ